MWTTKDIARFAAIGSLLLAGSCAAPTSDGVGYVADPEVNHPISVEPAYHSIKLPFSMTNEGLMPEDAAHFSLFVEDFMNSGNGAISITAPSGSGANSAISYFGERLASLGVPRDRILVGTKPGDGDTRVEIAFVSYKAHVGDCVGQDWTKDWGDTADNQPPPTFGCAVQKNIAAMVADPRDLVQQRAMGPSDAARRTTVMGHYEKGEITQSDKHTGDKAVEQSGESSSVQ